MAEVTPPLFQTIDAVYNAADLGLPYRDLLAPGVLASGSLQVTQRGAGANMSVDVAEGAAWVGGTINPAAQPPYRVYNDGTVNLALAAAHGSNARVDLIVAQVRDAAFSGLTSDWRLLVVQGTPAPSPAWPTVPANSLLLAAVTVPAATGDIEDGDIADLREPATVDASRVGQVELYAGAVPFGTLALNGGVHLRARYPRLFALLGTEYNMGGEAATEFRLPNMAARAPIGVGGGYSLGEVGGVEEVTLTGAQSGVPTHTHSTATWPGSSFIVGPSVVTVEAGSGAFAPASVAVQEQTGSVYGGAQPASQAHENRPPFLTLNFAVRA